MQHMRDLLRYAMDATPRQDEAARLLELLSRGYIDSPTTPTERNARNNIYAQAVHFVYELVLK
jgi:hypothetical protein